MMTEPFRHNSWATLRLLDFCRDIDPSLLDATAPGTYGPVKDTLAHLVGEEETLAGMAEGIPASGSAPAYSTLDDLQERARWLAERWERVLEGEPHPERLVQRDGGLVRLGNVLAQAVHSGNALRAEVGVILRNVGLQPPATDGWAYGAWLAERPDRRRREAL
jgi:uncharacterized damage-inducible protein DinB